MLGHQPKAVGGQHAREATAAASRKGHVAVVVVAVVIVGLVFALGQPAPLVADDAAAARRQVAGDVCTQDGQQGRRRKVGGDDAAGPHARGHDAGEAGAGAQLEHGPATDVPGAAAGLEQRGGLHGRVPHVVAEQLMLAAGRRVGELQPQPADARHRRRVLDAAVAVAVVAGHVVGVYHGERAAQDVFGRGGVVGACYGDATGQHGGRGVVRWARSPSSAGSTPHPSPNTLVLKRSEPTQS